MYSPAKAVFPLYEMVKLGELQQIQSQLKLDSPLSLVNTEQLKFTGLIVNLTIEFTIDDFSQIMGEELILMDGGHEIFTTRILDEKLQFFGIPVGIYTMRLPTGKKTKYQLDQQYAVVKHGDTVLNINFNAKKTSGLVSQQINLLGVGDEQFATVTTDASNGMIHVDVTKIRAHNYFANKIYAEITVKDVQGNIVFSKATKGNNLQLSYETIPFTTGYQLEIYHMEQKTRLKVSSDINAIVDTRAKLNAFLMTPFGLKNRAMNNNPSEDLQCRIASEVAKLKKHPAVWHGKYASPKDDVELALNLYEGDELKYLQDLYEDVLSKDSTVQDLSPSHIQYVDGMAHAVSSFQVKDSYYYQHVVVDSPQPRNFLNYSSLSYT